MRLLRSRLQIAHWARRNSPRASAGSGPKRYTLPTHGEMNASGGAQRVEVGSGPKAACLAPSSPGGSPATVGENRSRVGIIGFHPLSAIGILSSNACHGPYSEIHLKTPARQTWLWDTVDFVPGTC